MRNIRYIYCSTEDERRALGIVEFLLKDSITESKKDFYRTTLAREWIYKAYENKEYEISEDYVTANIYESLFYAILSGSRERANYMANLFGGRVEEKEDSFVSIVLGYGLKYLILDDKENAYEYLNKLEESKEKRGMKQYYNGYWKAYKGIIDRDEKIFNEGLLFLLKNHKSRMKKNGNTLEQYFAYDSIALAMIAKERGVDIEIKHELLPLEYLESVDVQYSKLAIFD